MHKIISFFTPLILIVYVSSCRHCCHTELLREANSVSEEIEIRRQLYAMPEKGHRVLIDALADKTLNIRVAGFGSKTDSFHIIWRNGPRCFFVNLNGEEETELSDLNMKLHKRLETDDTYLNHFIEANDPGNGINMEECVDELLDKDSIPSSRRIAHAYLEHYEGLSLDYDPLCPVADMPGNISQVLIKWKEDHYKGSHWEAMDKMNRKFGELMNPPGLNVKKENIPVPAKIPYETQDDRDAYVEYYKRAYLKSVNSDGNTFSTCCLFGNVPNRKAKVAGHYAGQMDGREAKKNAVKKKYNMDL